MDELLARLKIEDLPASQREIAVEIGLDNYLKLVRMVSGDSIYICKEDAVAQCVRNADIRKKFNGYNYAALAREYGLTVRSVRGIVGETAATHVIDGQLSVWSEIKE